MNCAICLRPIKQDEQGVWHDNSGSLTWSCGGSWEPQHALRFGEAGHPWEDELWRDGLGVMQAGFRHLPDDRMPDPTDTAAVEEWLSH